MMRLTSLVPVLLLAFLLTPLVRAADDEPPTPSEQAKAYAKEFKKGMRKMTSADVKAGVDKIVAYYNDKKVDDKRARKDLLEALEKASKNRDYEVVAHVMTKCGEMDENAVKIILPTLKRELSQKVPTDSVYEAALDSLGKLHCEQSFVIKELTGLLNNKEYPVVARAVRACAGYAAASGRIRKDLFEAVLKIGEGPYGGAQQNNENLKRKWAVIGDDVMEALNALSGVKHPDPVEARKWWNANDKADWDKKDN